MLDFKQVKATILNFRQVKANILNFRQVKANTVFDFKQVKATILNFKQTCVYCTSAFPSTALTNHVFLCFLLPSCPLEEQELSLVLLSSSAFLNLAVIDHTGARPVAGLLDKCPICTF
eukprot:137295-Hanusia_phi.AAC.1